MNYMLMLIRSDDEWEALAIARSWPGRGHRVEIRPIGQR